MLAETVNKFFLAPTHPLDRCRSNFDDRYDKQFRIFMHKATELVPTCHGSRPESMRRREKKKRKEKRTIEYFYLQTTTQTAAGRAPVTTAAQ